MQRRVKVAAFMDFRETAGVILVVAFLAANLPFISGRVLMVGPRRLDRWLGLLLIEWMLFGCLAFGIGLVMEMHIGQVHPKGWAFYVALACFYLTLALPGAVWCFLRQRPH